MSARRIPVGTRVLATRDIYDEVTRSVLYPKGTAGIVDRHEGHRTFVAFAAPVTWDEDEAFEVYRSEIVEATP